MKKYFKRLFLALINKSYCDCDYSSVGVYKREDLNPEFLKIVDGIEGKLNSKNNDENHKG